MTFLFVKDLGSYFGGSGREAGMAADNKVDDVNVVGGASVLAAPEFNSEEFTFSENVRTKGLQGQILSEGIVHNSGLPQIEYFHLQLLSSTFCITIS